MFLAMIKHTFVAVFQGNIHKVRQIKLSKVDMKIKQKKNYLGVADHALTKWSIGNVLNIFVPVVLLVEIENFKITNMQKCTPLKPRIEGMDYVRVPFYQRVVL